VLERQQLRDASGWRTAASRLRQAHGLRWEIEVDEAVATLLAGCDGELPLRVPLGLLAASLAATAADVARALVPVVRDLVGRGFLEPAGRR
jgi:hypothetical protein